MIKNRPFPHRNASSHEAGRRLTGIRWMAPLAGLAALLWFLVRVLPKPSRAAYPCQRAAAPLASGFVLWLLSLAGSAAAFRNARLARIRSRPALAALCAAAGLFATTGVFLSVPSLRALIPSAPQPVWTPHNTPNTPIGEARGIHPGRVTWIHDPAATSWNDAEGHWWEDANTDPAVVSNMLSKTIRWLAGSSSDSQPWDALFRHFNLRRDRGDVGYGSGEKTVFCS